MLTTGIIISKKYDIAESTKNYCLKICTQCAINFFNTKKDKIFNVKYSIECLNGCLI